MSSRRAILVTLILTLCLDSPTVTLSSTTALSDVVIRIRHDNDGNANEGRQSFYYGALAHFGASDSTRFEHTSARTLRYVKEGGCSTSDYEDARGVGENNEQEHLFVAVMKRGNCTFTKKANLASSFGASAVLVANDLSAMYENETTGILRNGCDVNCDVKEMTKIACETNKRCGSSICTSVATSDHGQAFCCVTDEVQEIHIDSNVTIPTVFVSIRTGNDLLERMASSPSDVLVDVYARPTEFSISVVVIWLIGVFTVALASFRGAWAERKRYLERIDRNDGESADEHDRARLVKSQTSRENEEGDDSLPKTVLTCRHVVCYLVLASTFLLVLYFLIRMGVDIVIFVIIMFCLASISALSFLILEPLVKRLAPRLNQTRCCSCTIPGTTNKERIVLSVGEVLVLVVAVGVVVAWFVERHDAWYVQNVLGMCVCVTFTVLVEIPNLKIATMLLVAFFFYDIFAVFLSPLIFKSSVMLEVATAGGDDHTSSQQGTNECSFHYGEKMPMLFLVPRTDWIGGYSMLGFGDVIFPSLLVTLMLKVDYRVASTFSCDRRRRVWYFPVLVFGYGIGLFLAFLANTLGWTINGVQGQPALLYLVPCTLGPSLFMAWRRKELAYLWSIGMDLEKKKKSSDTEEADHFPGSKEADHSPEA